MWCSKTNFDCFFASIFCRRGHVQGYAIAHIFTFLYCFIWLLMFVQLCTHIEVNCCKRWGSDARRCCQSCGDALGFCALCTVAEVLCCKDALVHCWRDALMQSCTWLHSIWCTALCTTNCHFALAVLQKCTTHTTQYYALCTIHFAHKRYVGASTVLLYSEKFSATLRQQLTPEEKRGEGEWGIPHVGSSSQ